MRHELPPGRRLARPQRSSRGSSVSLARVDVRVRIGAACVGRAPAKHAQALSWRRANSPSPPRGPCTVPDDPHRRTRAERAHRSSTSPMRRVETLEADEEAPPQPIVRRGGTFESFRYRDFTWFWSGALVCNIGTWMQNYALGIVVYSLRSSDVRPRHRQLRRGHPGAVPRASRRRARRPGRPRKLLIWIQVVLLRAGRRARRCSTTRASSPPSSARRCARCGWPALGHLAGIFAAIHVPGVAGDAARPRPARDRCSTASR